MSDSASPALATFRLYRDHDVSGISGAGVVAEGVQFSTGWVVTHWLDQAPMWEPKTDVWLHKGTGPVTKIHGHGGSTRIVWTADEERSRQDLAAGIAQAFGVPPEVCGPEAESGALRKEVERLLSGAAQEVRRDYVPMGGFGSVPYLALITGVLPELADAITPLLDSLRAQRDRAWSTVGRAYALAHRWQGAHGSSNILVRAAGAELCDELVDDSGAPPEGVVHSGEAEQVSGLSGVDYMAAAECSAQYHGFPDDHRQCIRAGQHRGDHIDSHGFHWSDTVAVYPVVGGPDFTSPLAGRIEVRDPCPYCTGSPMFPRQQLRAHIEEQHARVLAVLASGGSLDAQLAEPETRCRVPHEMEG
ncbi:hypothetical protein [Streptomyces sp. NPDC004528]|uniref:hypothetical protein n=1 Tax=Streptomyces sp. NPDC004528 TaxID=3154550 RepID=UPI0033A446E0